MTNLKTKRINYNQNYMIFNSKLIGKPVELRILHIISDELLLVNNLSGDDPTEILRWGLRPKNLQQNLSHIKRIYYTHGNKEHVLIQVIYRGKIKGKETFEIKQKFKDKYYPLPLDFSCIHERPHDYSVSAPRSLGGGNN